MVGRKCSMNLYWDGLKMAKWGESAVISLNREIILDKSRRKNVMITGVFRYYVMRGSGVWCDGVHDMREFMVYERRILLNVDILVNSNT